MRITNCRFFFAAAMQPYRLVLKRLCAALYSASHSSEFGLAIVVLVLKEKSGMYSVRMLSEWEK